MDPTSSGKGRQLEGSGMGGGVLAGPQSCQETDGEPLRGTTVPLAAC